MTRTKLATLVAALFSVSVFAGPDFDKIGSTFKELDNDQDGLISKEEADDDEIWEHFSLIDSNSDGNLSQKEYSSYMDKYIGAVAEDSEVAKSGEIPNKKELDDIDHDFSELDDDDNGYVSLAEAEGHDVNFHFGYIDTDNDRRLSQQEFELYIETQGKAVAKMDDDDYDN